MQLMSKNNRKWDEEQLNILRQLDEQYPAGTPNRNAIIGKLMGRSPGSIKYANKSLILKNRSEKSPDSPRDNNIYIGIDEVGVGAIAGPIVVAAVLPKEGCFSPRVVDCKKIKDDEKLQAAANEIKENSEWYFIQVIDPEFIKNHGMALALKSGTTTCIKKSLACYPGRGILVHDLGGRLSMGLLSLDEFSSPQLIMNGCDKTDFAVSAASILAKDRHDEIMQAYDAQYPGYLFGKHKGYGTPEHKEILRQRGPSPIHHNSTPTKHEPTGEVNQDTGEKCKINVKKPLQNKKCPPNQRTINEYFRRL